MALEFDEASLPPVPPADLIMRVTQGFDADQLAPSNAAFVQGGRLALRSLEGALASIGREFADFERLLDFGCRCGRYLNHLGPLSRNVEIHGVDIDAEMIAWMRDNVPFGSYVVGPHEPPLPYQDGYFDLVINHSVFTHIDERMQDLWLAELRRITRPGAVLLLTVEGLTVWNRALTQLAGAGEDAETYRQALEEDGIVHITEDHFVGSTHPEFYHSTFHASWYIFEHWTEYFDVAAYLPSGANEQDLLILRRRPDGEPAPTPVRHRHPELATGPPPVAVPGRTSVRRVVPGAARRVRRRFAGRAELGEPGARGARDLAELRRMIAQRDRALNMLNVGLYEQGRRISVLAAQLREEIAQTSQQESTDPRE